MARVVVIGGGIAGLVAARRLVTEDHNVTVLEASPAFGGKTQTLQIDGFPVEMGPEWFGSEPNQLLGLCAELGLEAQPIPQLRRVVRKKDKDWVLPDSLDLSNGTGLDTLGQLRLSRGAKWKLTTERFTRPSDSKEETLWDFVTRRLGAEVWDVLEPMISAEWGGSASELSVQAGFKVLEELETQGGLVNASKKRPKSVRYTVADGLGNVIKTLAEGLLEKQVILANRSEAVGITRDRRAWKVHLKENAIEADAVVVALPAPQAAKFFRPSAAQIATSLNHFKHNHAAKVWLAYPSELEPLEFFPALGEGFTAQVIRVFEASQGIQWIRISLAGDKARSADAELTRIATKDVGTYAKSKLKPVGAWAFRHPNSRPQFTLRHSLWVTALERPLLQAPGVFVTGSYLSGPGLSQLVTHAQQTANQALDFLALGTSLAKI